MRTTFPIADTSARGRIAVVLPPGAINSAFKVVGSLNYPERKKKLESITKDNLVL